MNVGVRKVTLRLAGNQSLKGKRRVLHSLCTRIHHKFNVAIAEVGDNHAWQMATLGITSVSNSVRHTNQLLDGVLAFIENGKEDVEILESEQEIISGF